LVEQELYALLISYNITRWLMFQAASEYGVKALELSFLDSLQWIIDAVNQVNVHNYLSKLIAESGIDRPRRNRVNPRVVKIKMSKFKSKRKVDKGENIDYEKVTEIIFPHEEVKNSTYEKAA
jgi:hypothetical protein